MWVVINLLLITAELYAIGKIGEKAISKVAEKIGELNSKLTWTVVNFGAITGELLLIKYLGEPAFSGMISKISNLNSELTETVIKLGLIIAALVAIMLLTGGGAGAAGGALSLAGGIPGFSIGTKRAAGGFAYINENHRGELVNLPNGAQVIPHDVSMQYARNAARNMSSQDGGMINNNSVSQTINFNQPVDSPVQVYRAMKKASQEVAFSV